MLDAQRWTFLATILCLSTWIFKTELFVHSLAVSLKKQIVILLYFLSAREKLLSSHDSLLWECILYPSNLLKSYSHFSANLYVTSLMAQSLISPARINSFLTSCSTLYLLAWLQSIDWKIVCVCVYQSRWLVCNSLSVETTASLPA